MSFNVLDTAKNLLPHALVSKAAISLGETEPNTRKALKGAIPSVLAGLLYQFSRGNASAVGDLLKKVVDSGIADQLANLKKTNPAIYPAAGFNGMMPGWLNQLFGGKLINIINAISIYSDIKSSSASAILNMAAPAALSAVAAHTEENKLSPGEIEAFLQNQKPLILAGIPAGFNLAGSLGVDSLDDLGARIHHSLPEPLAQRKPSRGNAARWIWPILLLLTFGGLVWFFSKKGSGDEETTTANTDTLAVPVQAPADILNNLIAGRLDSLTGNFIYDPGTLTELKLADTILQAGQHSTEARLYRLLGDSSWKVDTIDKTKNWISLDRVYFETNKSILSAGSLSQVNNIAILLKNFPNSAIKLGGYTDNEGDSVLNKKLSEARAKLVMGELLKLGVPAHQLTEATGYGPDHPVCPANDTPECKARNRRVDLKVERK